MNQPLANKLVTGAAQPGLNDPELSSAEGPMFDAQKKRTSVGHFRKPKKIAETVAYFARPSANFINGESLTVFGGWNA